MRFAEFIRANKEEIASEWERFAATLLPREEFSASVLRNSIEEILDSIARDMGTSQTGVQQSRKSKGETPSEAMEVVAEKHAGDRLDMGLSSRQVISEFRALRASVIRLWQEGRSSADQQDLQDLTRFNEAVDEALIEVQSSYTDRIEQSRELFLGVLGHDLRNPLHAILGAAEAIRRAPDADKDAMLADRMLVSVRRMAHMISDLTDLTRIKLGHGFALSPTKADMRDLCLRAIEEMKAAYADRKFELRADNDLSGEWDQPKLSQAISNLLNNAVQHGAHDSPITVSAQEKGSAIEVSIHNEGAAIPQHLLPKLFDIFVQKESGVEINPGSMGLGLYIAKQIVTAHGGTIKVESSDDQGTIFCFCVPQEPPERTKKLQYRPR
jgi:signal transduction histidine kinase